MNSQSSDKYQSFWPLPGRIEDFVETLLRSLKFIHENKPSEDWLRKWFFGAFPTVTKEGNVRTYINTVLKHSGLLTWDRSGFYLSEDGRRYLEKPDNKVLFEILDRNVTGFRETVEFLGSNPLDLDGLHKALNSRLGMKWKIAYGQPYWRVSWLRSMGFVELSGHEYHLTSEGKELLKSFSEVVPEEKKILVTYAPIESKEVSVTVLPERLHDQLVMTMYSLGEIFGYKSEKSVQLHKINPRTPLEQRNRTVDVIWKTGETYSQCIPIEVQAHGSIDALIRRLKLLEPKAWRMIVVGNEQDLKSISSDVEYSEPRAFAEKLIYVPQEKVLEVRDHVPAIRGLRDYLKLQE